MDMVRTEGPRRAVVVLLISLLILLLFLMLVLLRLMLLLLLRLRVVLPMTRNPLTQQIRRTRRIRNQETRTRSSERSQGARARVMWHELHVVLGLLDVGHVRSAAVGQTGGELELELTATAACFCGFCCWSSAHLLQDMWHSSCIMEGG